MILCDNNKEVVIIYHKDVSSENTNKDVVAEAKLAKHA